MKKGLRILLILVAVACFGVALYYPIHYRMEEQSSNNTLGELIAMRDAGLEDTNAEESPEVAPGAMPPEFSGLIDQAGNSEGTANTDSNSVANAGESSQGGEGNAEDGESLANPALEARVRSLMTAMSQGSADAYMSEPEVPAEPGVEPEAEAEVPADEREVPAEDAEAEAEAPAEDAEADAEGSAEGSAENAKTDAEMPAEDSEAEAESATVSGKKKSAVVPVPKSTPTPEITPEPTPVPSPTPEPTVTPTPAPTVNRWERLGALPYGEKDLVTLDVDKILPEYREIYKVNNDFVGWLTIPGINLDSPVVQTEDSEYYLHRDFFGEENANGQIILDAKCDPYTPSYNLVISGHNMRSGKMFGNLPSYSSKSFWQNHKLIEFDNLMERKLYVVMAAFYSANYDVDEEGFRYNADIQYSIDLKNWLREIEENQIYDTEIDAEFGDEFLTLTTCNYHRKNGRFVVICRKVRDGEQY